MKDPLNSLLNSNFCAIIQMTMKIMIQTGKKCLSVQCVHVLNVLIILIAIKKVYFVLKCISMIYTRMKIGIIK